MNEQEKSRVLTAITQGELYTSAEGGKYRFKNKVLHIRFCAIDDRGSTRFKFNINPNTLSADYEIWVCGDAGHYYLIPIEFIREIYEHPHAYQDNAHPGIKVITADRVKHQVLYAAGGEKKDISSYFLETLS